jgi:hypothetical protein
MLAVYGGRAPQLDRCELLYPQAKLDKSVAEFTGKFPLIEQVRHGKLERQKEHLLKQGRPF